MGGGGLHLVFFDVRAKTASHVLALLISVPHLSLLCDDIVRHLKLVPVLCTAPILYFGAT